MKNLILITCLLQAALAAPQFISFKDGKVGVNFLGYHAQAGLGGGENGGLFGGLHASAGTPWGQNAAAGVGGNVNRRAAGVLYAGAQATPDIGAGAVLGGDTSRGGFSGSEAYANGKVASRTRTIVSENTLYRHENTEPHLPLQPVAENVNAIQKIRPPKKYYSSEADDFVNIDDYNGVALYTNKTESIHDIKQEKPAAAASVVIKKIINKTTFTTPFQSTGKHNNAPSSTAPVEQTLNIDANDSNNHYPFTSNESNTTPSASSSLPATPSIIHSSSVSLSHSLNENNSNGNIARGVNSNDATAVIITRDRTKFRTHSHKHRRNHHPKRINLNRQRQRSKTIVKVVEQEEHPPATQHQQYLSAEELFSIETQKQQNNPQTYRQQQQPVRRQLIAPLPHDLPAHPCDPMKQECKNVQEEARPDVVQSALQIPIGILQSLQHSLGNFGAH